MALNPKWSVRSWTPIKLETLIMLRMKTLLAMLFAAGMTFGLSACGDTWEGLKEDTADNAEAAGEAIEEAGEKIKDAAK